MIDIIGIAVILAGFAFLAYKIWPKAKVAAPKAIAEASVEIPAAVAEAAEKVTTAVKRTRKTTAKKSTRR